MYYDKYNLYQVKIDDLEKTILACLLLKSELMKSDKLTDDLFIENDKIWQFMKSVYKKFGMFDLSLMYNIVSNKFNYMGFIAELLNIECVPSNFDYYVEQLKSERELEKKEKYKITAIFNLANDLLLRNITLNEFKERIEEMFKED